MRLASILGLFLCLSLRAEEPIAATVNGEPIRLAEVDAVLKRVKPAAPLTAAQTRSLREAVLDELIDELLMTQYVKKNTPAPDRKRIDEQMTVLIEAQKALGKTLADYCRETGFSEAQLRASFETSLRWRTHVDSKTTAADFQKYFESNRDAFEGTTVKLSHILLRLPAGATDGEANAARETLRVLKGDLEAKRITFAEAAKRHSIDITAKAGGDLGTIRRKDGLVEETIAAAAFALPVNGISDPIRTPSGLHLVTVTLRTPGPRLTYEQCAEAVKESYADDARNRLATELRRQALVKITLP
jgi:peptidyl-prolyl cis-trans isomerase C